MFKLIDTHAHLEELENIDQIITAAKSAGIAGIICVGSGFNSNKKVIELSRIYEKLIFPALGLHPWEIHGQSVDELKKVFQQIENNINSICAIGEVGLDYNKHLLKLTSKESQKEILKRLLEIAVKYNKPVSLHSRYAWKDCLDCIIECGVTQAVFHWFTGFSSVLKDILDGGYYISCTPAVEYHEEHRRAVKDTPLKQLLLETDTPVFYGKGEKYQARPADVLRCLKMISELKGISTDIVAEQTTLNAIKLFNLNL